MSSITNVPEGWELRNGKPYKTGEPSSAPPAKPLTFQQADCPKCKHRFTIEVLKGNVESVERINPNSSDVSNVRAADNAVEKEKVATRQIWDSITRVAESLHDDDTCRLSQRACQILLDETWIQEAAKRIFGISVEAEHNRGPEWGVETIVAVIKEERF